VAAIDLVAAATRVAMVWPPSGTIAVGVADLRAEPADDAELVDQAHFGERIRVLGERGERCYVQGEDLYLGWIRRDAAFIHASQEARLVSVLMAPLHERPDPRSAVLGHAPAGTLVPEFRHYLPESPGLQREVPKAETGPWLEVVLARPDARNRFVRGYLTTDSTVRVADLPLRYPTPADYLKTAESFIGVPYLWGGTTALGLDCSGFVQQVYRLNGVALPRDADQQAMLGRKVEEARAGDLMFFGAESVDHVALATGADDFIHAPMKGGVVQRGRVGGDRILRGIRRCLPDGSTT